MTDQRKSWFIEIGGKKVGPLAEADVLNLHKVGKVSDTTKFIRDGMDSWVSFSETGIINDEVPPLPNDDIIPPLPDIKDASSLQAQRIIKSISASHFLTSGTLYLYEDKIEFVCNNTTSIPFWDVADVYLDKELVIIKLTNDKEYFFDVIPDSLLQEWVKSIKAQWQVFNRIAEVEEAPQPLNDNDPSFTDEDKYDYHSSAVLDETQIDTPVSVAENVPISENKIDSAVKKASGIVENIRHEVTTSETIANIKATASTQIDTAAKKASVLVDILPDNISNSETVATAKEKLHGRNSRVYIIIGALCLIAAVALIIFVPFIRWIVLVLTLGWVGFSFYKKSSKVLPIVAAVIALALIIVLPSGGGAGRGGGGSDSIDGTWVWQGEIGGVPSTMTYEFNGDRFTITQTSTTGTIFDGVRRGTFSTSASSIYLTFDGDTTRAPATPFSRSGRTITIGGTQYTRR
jgi:hypothetical protein